MLQHFLDVLHRNIFRRIRVFIPGSACSELLCYYSELQIHLCHFDPRNTGSNMRKLIVGCGYLGKRIAREWISQGHQVFALTRSPDRANQLRQAGIEPLIGDVTQAPDFRDLESLETVLYSVGFDRHSGQSRQAVTIDGLRKILACLPEKVARLLYISTTSVYGIDDGSWVDADTHCEPKQENGILALQAERILKSFAEEHRVSAGILRLSGIYGRGRLLARQQSLMNAVPISANPSGWLNLIHVEDAVTAILACETQGQSGATYLVSDDLPIPRREYYSLLARLVGAPEPKFDSSPEEFQRLNKRCDNRRTKDELDWTPRFPTFAEGLPDAVLAE